MTSGSETTNKGLKRVFGMDFKDGFGMDFKDGPSALQKDFYSNGPDHHNLVKYSSKVDGEMEVSPIENSYNMDENIDEMAPKGWLFHFPLNPNPMSGFLSDRSTKDPFDSDEDSVYGSLGGSNNSSIIFESEAENSIEICRLEEYHCRSRSCRNDDCISNEFTFDLEQIDLYHFENYGTNIADGARSILDYHELTGHSLSGLSGHHELSGHSISDLSRHSLSSLSGHSLAGLSGHDELSELSRHHELSGLSDLSRHEHHSHLPSKRARIHSPDLLFL